MTATIPQTNTLTPEEIVRLLAANPSILPVYCGERMKAEELVPLFRTLSQRFGSGRLDIARARAEQGDDSAKRSVCLEDVQEEKVQWLWPGYIPYGMLTLLFGDPGKGKGTLTLDLAARASRGLPLPLCSLEYEPISVLLLTIAEDDLAKTILPRLRAAGADCKKVFSFKDITVIPDEIPRIRAEIEERAARLVILDPLNAYLADAIDGHKDQHIRRALAPLKLLAEETGAAIILVHHLNKSAGTTPALYRSGGSIGIVGAARAVFLAADDPQVPGQYVLSWVKGNLSPPPPSLAYSLETAPDREVPRIIWGGTVGYSADSLVSAVKASDGPTASSLTREQKESEILAAIQSLGGKAKTEQVAEFLSWDTEMVRRQLEFMRQAGRLSVSVDASPSVKGRGRKPFVYQIAQPKESVFSSTSPMKTDEEKEENKENSLPPTDISSNSLFSSPPGVEGEDEENRTDEDDEPWLDE